VAVDVVGFNSLFEMLYALAELTGLPTLYVSILCLRCQQTRRQLKLCTTEVKFQFSV